MFRPGDILLFESSKSPSKNLLKSLFSIFTKKITHIGIVLTVYRDWVVWAEIQDDQICGNLSSPTRLQEGLEDGLRFIGVSRLPNSWYADFPLENLFTVVSNDLLMKSKSFSSSPALCVTILDSVIRQYKPDWNPNKTDFSSWKISDFTVKPFRVEPIY